MNKNMMALLLLLTTGLFFSCSRPTDVAGTGSETGNARTVVGNLVNEDGSAAAGTNVYLRPKDYLTSLNAKIAASRTYRSLDSILTDSLGRFAFDSIAAGTYVLEGLEPETHKGVLIDSVIVAHPDSILELSADTLKDLGGISGRIENANRPDLLSLRVLVYGLNRTASPDSSGRFSISGLPEGRYEFRVVAPDTFWDLRGDSAITVTAGDTTSMQVACPIKSYYVSTTGSDSALGTISNPFRTVKRGLQVLSSGDTLNIRGGTYSEPGFSSPNIHPIPDGNPDVFTVIRGYPGENITIAHSFEGAYGGFNFESGSYIALENLILEGPGNNVGDWTGVRFTDSVHHIRLANVEISDFSGNGMLALPGAHHLEVIGCNVHHCGNMVDKGAGMVFSGDSSLFDGNRFHHNTQQGVELFGEGNVSSDHNIIRNNKIDSNGLGDQGTGLVIDGSYNRVYNNVIFRNQMAGIDIGYTPGSSYNVIFNNTITLNVGAGIFVGVWTPDAGGTVANHLANNILFRNGVNLIDTLPQHNTILQNNFTDDPLFADTANADFQLMAESPAIDLGVNLSAEGVLNDILGTVRPQGDGYDIGAYEFVPGTPTGKFRRAFR